MITEETISRVKSSLQATKSFLALEVIEQLEKENAELKQKFDDFIYMIQDTTKRSLLKENAELKQQAESDKKCLNCLRMTVNQDEYISGMEEKLNELEAQIENMQCCGNCKHNIKPTTKESTFFCCECKKLDETKDNIILTKWELAE